MLCAIKLVKIQETQQEQGFRISLRQLLTITLLQFTNMAVEKYFTNF